MGTRRICGPSFTETSHTRITVILMLCSLDNDNNEITGRKSSLYSGKYIFVNLNVTFQF
jgi:hypothetical protein